MVRSMLAGLLGIVTITSVVSPIEAAETAPKLNVVFILVDDLGWADLGCYGNTFNETPMIDRLAGEGMRFTDAYAACSVCSPTRASIMTGKYPATLHLTDYIPGHRRPWAKLAVPTFNQALPLDEVTIAEALKPAGYVSGHFGKWHLGPGTHYPDKQGFDTSIVHNGQHFYPQFRTTPEIDIEDGAYLADVLTDRAVQFIETNRDKPFFLHLSHFAVHIPLQAKPESIAKYAAKPRPAEGVNNPTYAAMLESVDQSVGRIMAKLDELDLTRRTLVIFTSDNGGLIRSYAGTGPVVTSNASLRGEKGTLYEGGIRVPLIVRWPGVVDPGKTSDVPVCSIDYLPTIAIAAGCAVAPAWGVDGVSLMPVLTQSGGLDRDALYWHYPHYHHDTPAGAIRQGRFKLIEHYEDGALELYDLSADVGERMNLAARMPDRAAAMRKKLAAWRKSVNAQENAPNPDFDPAREPRWGQRPNQVPPTLPKPRILAPPTPGDKKAPDGSPTARRPFRATLPAEAFGAQGTAAIWFKPDELLSGKRDKLPLVESEAWQTFIRPQDDCVWVLVHGGPRMTGKRLDGEKGGFYWFGGAFTHLKKDRWYHAVWTWDIEDARRNGFFLDGVRQCDGPNYGFPGQLKAVEGGDVALEIGCEGLTVGSLMLYPQPLPDDQLKRYCEKAGHPGYTDEGVVFDAERFVPTDVDWARPAYQASFDDASALKDWRLEGGAGMRVAGGNLVLENTTEPMNPQATSSHLVCWLTKEMPADFLLEFTVRPRDRQRGLNIVFFNARGLNGENIFEPPIADRDGTFPQYHSGDLNNYHISYWAGGRGTANCRKNRGFHLAAVGEDLVNTTPANAFQTVRLYKRGGRIRLMVDDIVSVKFDDDGKLFGPVHTHSGWIGLRQMAHTDSCEYGYVRVYPLK